MNELMDEIDNIIHNTQLDYTQKTTELEYLFRKELPTNTVVLMRAFERDSFGIIVDSSNGNSYDLIVLMQTLSDKDLYCQHIDRCRFTSVFSECYIEIIKCCDSYVDALECFLSCVKDGKKVLENI